MEKLNLTETNACPSFSTCHISSHRSFTAVQAERFNTSKETKKNQTWFSMYLIACAMLLEHETHTHYYNKFNCVVVIFRSYVCIKNCHISTFCAFIGHAGLELLITQFINSTCLFGPTSWAKAQACILFPKHSLGPCWHRNCQWPLHLAA